MPISHERIEAWLAAAVADAERRGLRELKGLLETLARSTAALRAADETYSRRTDHDEHAGR
jgi:hypothetical protein